MKIASGVDEIIVTLIYFAVTLIAKLNLLVEGKGTVWIDDIRLLKAPLK